MTIPEKEVIEAMKVKIQEEHKIAKVFKDPSNSASGEVLGENNVFCN